MTAPHRWVVLTGIALAAGCTPGAVSGGDAGPVDAGRPLDSGARTDGGGPGPDAGGTPDAGGPTDGGFVLPSGRYFPDTWASTAILSDQLPSMNAAQLQFAASHYVGTEKQLVPVTQALRALNANFLVLHYHLSMWQSAPATAFIIDGGSWGNDYPVVTSHEDWFWHNDAGERVTSSADQKLLMNISVPAFQQYWAASLEAQVAEGQYDAIFFDSASPALLQGECGGTGANQDPRLATTSARDTMFSELGGVSWITAWESWMGSLAGQLTAQGIPLLPNTSAFTTGWDNTNYALTPGAFVEGFAGTQFAPSDWAASTNQLLALSNGGKILILQNYLSAPTDVATRLYYLGNYLLVKGHLTYLEYFAQGPLEWYPEWGVDLGAPLSPLATDVSGLASAGVYRRDFTNGVVLVNPSGAAVTVPLGATFQQVVPSGGGAVDTSGNPGGSLAMQPVSSVAVPGPGAVLLLH